MLILIPTIFLSKHPTLVFNFKAYFLLFLEYSLKKGFEIFKKHGILNDSSLLGFKRVKQGLNKLRVFQIISLAIAYLKPLRFLYFHIT